MNKEFICDCVDPNYQELGLNGVDSFCEWLETKEDLSVEEFVNFCELSTDILKSIIMYPNDFEFYKIGEVFFYCHSCVEHFYK